MLTHVVLGLLRDGRSAHVYELARDWARRVSSPMPTAGLYREAARLVGSGLIEPARISLKTAEDDRRQPYAITDRGCWVFDQWLAAGETEDDLLVRVAFFDLLRAETRLTLLRRWEGQLGRRIEELRDRLDHPEVTQAPAATAIAIRRMIGHLEAEVAFLDDVRRTVGAWSGEVDGAGHWKQTISCDSTTS